MGTSEEFHVVASLDELREAEPKLLHYAGEDVTLVRLGDEVFAIENTCPHQGASLAEGWIEDETISCPWHAWCFELRTGKMTLGDYASVKTYRVKIDAGKVALAAGSTAT